MVVGKIERTATISATGTISGASASAREIHAGQSGCRECWGPFSLTIGSCQFLCMEKPLINSPLSNCCVLPVQRGNVKLSNLDVLNAILHAAKHGCKRRGVPERFGD